MLHALIKLALPCFSVVLAFVPSSSIEDVSKIFPKPVSLSGDHDKFATVNGVKIWYSDFGSPYSEKMPVLFLHGGYLNSDYFSAAIHHLHDVQPSRRIIAMDVRGHGRSERNTEELSYKLFAKDATALLSQLGIREAAFVGWGFMAVTTMEAMLLEETKGFVGGAFLWGGYHSLAARNRAWNKDQNPLFKTVAERVREDFEMYQSLKRLAEFNPILVKFDQAGPNYSERDLSSITLGEKVTVAFGEHEEVVNHSEFEELAKMIHGSRSVIVPGVSHFGPVQNPNAIAEQIQEFLNVVDQPMKG